MSKKSRTSWQKRKRRRAKLILGTTLLCIVAIFGIFFVRALLSYDVVDLSDYCTYEYKGYNHKGSVVISIDQEKTSQLLRGLKDTYNSRIMHVYKCNDEDYNSFYNSLNVTADVPENLSNGSEFSYTVNYDKKLAKKLRLSVKKNAKTEVVSGLVTATILKLEDVFRDVSLAYEGVSPDVTVTLENNSTNPFVKNMVFAIIDPKEKYTKGDTVRVRAYFSEEECLDKHFAVEKPSDECIKEYVIDDIPEYIQSADELPKEIIDEAISRAKDAFTNDAALEFGLRVFSEANLMYVIDPKTKKYTFRWDSFRPISAYFKVPNEEKAGKGGNSYNDIDVCFAFVMTQADGKKCDGEAVVRFTNICKMSDGTYKYDFSNAKIISASHFDSRIKKNVIKNYEEDYTIEKLDIK